MLNKTFPTIKVVIITALFSSVANAAAVLGINDLSDVIYITLSGFDYNGVIYKDSNGREVTFPTGNTTPGNPFPVDENTVGLFTLDGSWITGDTASTDPNFKTGLGPEQDKIYFTGSKEDTFISDTLEYQIFPAQLVDNSTQLYNHIKVTFASDQDGSSLVPIPDSPDCPNSGIPPAAQSPPDTCVFYEKNGAYTRTAGFRGRLTLAAISDVPEPSTVFIMIIGMACIAFSRYRKLT